jgi:hypothetical protein
VTVGSVLAKGIPTLASASGRSPNQDATIMNFLLLLEYLQSAFYQDAIDKGSLKGELSRFAQVVGGHEKEHVGFLRSKLGSKARGRPDFDFGDATSTPTKFAATAMKLEELTIGAYIGQGANLTRDAVLRVGRIASVEGRHAAWIRDIRRDLPAPAPADAGAPQDQVTGELRATHFITGGAQ